MRDEGMKLLSFTHFHSYIRPNIIIIVIIIIILINNNNKGTANNPWASSSKDKCRSLVVPRKQGGRGLLQLEKTYILEVLKLMEYVDSRENSLVKTV